MQRAVLTPACACVCACAQDFVSAFDHVRPSVSQKDLASLQEWNEQYGSFKTTGEEALIAETDV